MKRSFFAAACGFALMFSASIPAAPLSAKEGDELSSEELAALGNLFGDMFGEAEPLTPEQEMRLPAAMQIVARLMPEGTLGRVMDESMKPMMESMTGGMAGSPAIALSVLTGLGPFELAALDDKQLEEALALLDPDAQERADAVNGAFFELISEVMIEVEPAYRAGLARAYATRFTKEELLDLSAYFATEVGSKFAGESYLIYTDPQVMSSMNEMMPAVMQRMPAILETIEQTAEKYPQGRSFSDLTEEEQARLAALLGVSEDELAASEPEQAESASEAIYEDA